MIDVVYFHKELTITFPILMPAHQKLGQWQSGQEEVRKIFKHELCPKLMQVDPRLRQPMIVKDKTTEKGYVVLKPFYLYEEPVCIWFIHYTNQPADQFLDNVAQKFVIDALRLSHIIPKDTSDYVSVMLSRKPYHGKPFTKVKVFPVSWMNVCENRHLLMRYNDIFPKDNEVNYFNQEQLHALFEEWEEKTERLLSFLQLYIDAPRVLLHFSHVHKCPFDVDNLMHRFVMKKLREKRYFDENTEVTFYITGRHEAETQPYTEVYLIPLKKDENTGQQNEKFPRKNLLTQHMFGSVQEESKIS